MTLQSRIASYIMIAAPVVTVLVIIWVILSAQRRSLKVKTASSRLRDCTKLSIDHKTNDFGKRSSVALVFIDHDSLTARNPSSSRQENEMASVSSSIALSMYNAWIGASDSQVYFYLVKYGCHDSSHHTSSFPYCKSGPHQGCDIYSSICDKLSSISMADLASKLICVHMPAILSDSASRYGNAVNIDYHYAYALKVIMNHSLFSSFNNIDRVMVMPTSAILLQNSIQRLERSLKSSANVSLTQGNNGTNDSFASIDSCMITQFVENISSLVSEQMIRKEERNAQINQVSQKYGSAEQVAPKQTIIDEKRRNNVIGKVVKAIDKWSDRVCHVSGSKLRTSNNSINSLLLPESAVSCLLGQEQAPRYDFLGLVSLSTTSSCCMESFLRDYPKSSSLRPGDIELAKLEFASLVKSSVLNDGNDLPMPLFPYIMPLQHVASDHGNSNDANNRGIHQNFDMAFSRVQSRPLVPSEYSRARHFFKCGLLNLSCSIIYASTRCMQRWVEKMNSSIPTDWCTEREYQVPHMPCFSSWMSTSCITSSMSIELSLCDTTICFGTSFSDRMISCDFTPECAESQLPYGAIASDVSIVSSNTQTSLDKSNQTWQSILACQWRERNNSLSNDIGSITSDMCKEMGLISSCFASKSNTLDPGHASFVSKHLLHMKRNIGVHMTLTSIPLLNVDSQEVEHLHTFTILPSKMFMAGIVPFVWSGNKSDEGDNVVSAKQDVLLHTLTEMNITARYGSWERFFSVMRLFGHCE